MNIKDFIVDTLGTFDTEFDAFEETSYHQEMLHADYASIVETILESDAPEAAELSEGPWSPAEMSECMERVLQMPDELLSSLTFKLLAQEIEQTTPKGE